MFCSFPLFEEKQMKKMENKTNITISEKSRNTLAKWKYAMNCKTYDETFEKIKKILSKIKEASNESTTNY